MKRLLIIFSFALAAFASCNFDRVKGNGNMVSKSYRESGFRDIDASSSLNVHLKQGSNYAVNIEAEENLIDLLKVRAEGDKLVIGFKKGTNVSPTRKIQVYITAPEFHEIEGSGACTFMSDGTLKGNELSLDLSGACKTKLEVDVLKLDVDASGASDIMLSGKAVDFSLDGSGSTSARCFDLLTQNADIGISGAGDADISVSAALKVDISGAGHVAYKGNPSSVTQDISGAGSLKKVE